MAPAPTASGVGAEPGASGPWFRFGGGRGGRQRRWWRSGGGGEIERFFGGGCRAVSAARSCDIHGEALSASLGGDVSSERCCLLFSVCYFVETAHYCPSASSLNGIYFTRCFVSVPPIAPAILVRRLGPRTSNTFGLAKPYPYLVLLSDSAGASPSFSRLQPAGV